MSRDQGSAMTGRYLPGLAAAAAIVLVGGCAGGGGSSTGAAHASGSASMSVAPTPAGTATAHIGHLTITGGYIPQPASPDVAAAYFTVANSGSSADTLTRVTTDVTRSVMPMNESDSGATGSMTDLPRVRIPAHGSFRFRPGHAHLMLEKPDRALRKGDRVQMRITFARAGTVTLTVPVVGLTGPTVSMPATSSSMPGGGMPGMSMSGGS